MAEIPIKPIGSGANPIAEAVAGNEGVIFTATDKQIIKERAGEVEQERTFREIFAKKPLMAEVDTEGVAVNSQQPVVEEIKSREKRSREALKHATVVAHRERVQITNKLPDDYQEGEKPPTEEPKAETPPKPAARADIKALAEELNVDKDLHLQRLLTESEDEFEKITARIINTTLASAKDETKVWLKSQLDRLTLESARYKLQLLESLEALETDEGRQRNIGWLKKVLTIYGPGE